MGNLLESLRNHDWYYMYSDDGRVYKRGRQRTIALRERMQSLECPFTMDELRMAAHKMIVEEFAEEEPGKWYRQPRKFKSIAPTQREDLITQDEYAKIMEWIVKQD